MSISANKLLVKQLIEFGLSEKEAKVYLALLELEVAAVSEIAKTANINRSSTYVVLGSLKKKGLVSVSEGKKVQNFVAASPDLLLHEAEGKAKKAEWIKSKISNIVPELKALYKGTKKRPVVKVFEGRRGVMACMEDTFGCKEKLMRVCSSHENWLRSDYDFRRFFEGYIQKRLKLGIKMRGIHPDTKISRTLTKLDPMKFDKVMLIPKKKYKFPAEMAIYDNKIGYISPDITGLAILIENRELAEVMKSVFDLAFEEAKRLSTNSGGKKRNR